MPTYEFRCPDGTIIERVFRMSEAPQAIPVPDGSGMAVRIISGGADLIFKGSGFYITDYGKDGKKDQRDSANKAEAKGPGAKAESGKGDTPTSGDTRSTAPVESGADAKRDPSKRDPSKGDSSKGDSSKGDSSKRDSEQPTRSSGSDGSKNARQPGPASPSSDAAA